MAIAFERRTELQIDDMQNAGGSPFLHESVAPYALIGLVVGSGSRMIGVKRHVDALKIFERYRIKAHSQAISMLGYRVKWSGLDPENAEIVRM